MSSSAAARLATTLRFTLTVGAGLDRGASYQLVSQMVTLGRDSDNHISLKDPKVSRRQATIEFQSERVVIKDLSSRDNVFVNGAPIREAALTDGDKIQIGDTHLVFRIETVDLQPTRSLAPLSHAPPAQARNSAPLQGHSQQAPMGFDPRMQGYSPGHSGARPRTRPQTQQASSGGSPLFYVLILIVGGFVAWAVLSDTPKPIDPKSLRTSVQIEEDIRISQERQELLIKERMFKDDAERSRFQEADGHYRQGFRDFQKQNYARAMRSFETASAIDPRHELARRYYQLSRRRRDEFVDRSIREGRKYKEKNMYSRCVGSLASAEKALGDLLNDNDLKIKEARALKSECEVLMKERF